MTGAAGLTVTLDGAIATTAADGTFAIDPPSGTIIHWEVTGPDLITSIMGFSAARTIPAMKDVDYFGLTSDNGVIPVAGQGDVFVHVVRAGASVPMVGATSTPLAEYPTVYDGGAPTTWTQLGTGAFGMVWIPGLAAGTTTVTLTPQTGTAKAVPSIPIGDGALTWVSVELP
ncbi:MAG: hypothetical protein ABI678_30900 [Kofleriaceae bacterium]